ncbi:peptidylprolyl isomerase [Parablastomonas sp. CN1-191]|uniref:peptidylprolyl isomerase n=1 Tax=Parablastomonas sp. CN1-191 TaxID=3400908 RepID=UPI003BF7BE07
MIRIPALGALALAAAASAQTPAPPPPPPPPGSSAAILATAAPAEWVRIAPSDLLVMDLARGRDAKARRVVIRLMPAPFAQGWVGNIRKLAAAHWWDGLSINRVQDNYVVQWGDADGEDAAKARALPAGLAAIPESAYTVPAPAGLVPAGAAAWFRTHGAAPSPAIVGGRTVFRDYNPARFGAFTKGLPFAGGAEGVWPVHCYGSIGVGRNLSPDTGTGAELYAVIGPARPLDRNIAVVGKVIEGMEWLSALPRGTGTLGFYETPAERTAIRSVRLGNEVPDLPAFEYLSSEGPTFAKYVVARANRQDDFFRVKAGGMDLCSAAPPTRRVKSG